jgi:hypothetical protein
LSLLVASAYCRDATAAANIPMITTDMVNNNIIIEIILIVLSQ